ncbi:MAG: hypothetical protein CVU07_03340 [Bacteroidetes bacterium HGW-Bacteroidetes-23]|nr:MAG: hypothetical protein CVU07_03340 [Bacteroidetes bacterium HGW-Bacteroidetes-23]
MSGVLILFFSYKSIIYLSHKKVDGNIIAIDYVNQKYYNKGRNGSNYVAGYKRVIVPTIEYNLNNQKVIITNPAWSVTNGFEVNEKVKILLNESNSPLHLATVTHFWFTSNEIIFVFSIIFTLPVIYSIFFGSKRTKRKPHPLFKNERI